MNTYFTKYLLNMHQKCAKILFIEKTDKSAAAWTSHMQLIRWELYENKRIKLAEM